MRVAAARPATRPGAAARRAPGATSSPPRTGPPQRVRRRCPPGASVPRGACRGRGRSAAGTTVTRTRWRRRCSPATELGRPADRHGAPGRRSRGFDMGDLRLLETVGAELATALDRGRLLHRPRAVRDDRRADRPAQPHRDDAAARRPCSTSTGRSWSPPSPSTPFREVNDTLGREVGDELLREVARRLPLGLPRRPRRAASAARRFAVAVPARQVAGRRGALRSRPCGPESKGAPSSAPSARTSGCRSAWSTRPSTAATAATLLRRAETAMYSARHVGGGPVLWEPAYEVQGNRRLAVVMALREALAERRDRRRLPAEGRRATARV